MINTLVNIYKDKGKAFIEKLFNNNIIVFEQIDGSRFLFSKNKETGLHFYKKDNDEINYIDRTLMRFYENGISYIQSLPIEISSNIPDNWTFGFQYFPSTFPINITYDRMPKNHLILTDISVRTESGKVVKVIHDINILKDWAERLDVEGPPIIFNGTLSDYQKLKLIEFIETPELDLYNLFKTTSFTRYMISLLNPTLMHSALMNDLEKSIEGIVFKFININSLETISARLIDPVFYYSSKNSTASPRKSNDMYQIVMLDIVEFFEQYDINKMQLDETNTEEKYVEIISILFNDYIKENAHRYFGIDFESPDFSKRQDFDVNMSFIKNEKTKEFLSNDHLKNLFKIMLSSFRKHRKNPTDILTQTIIDNINSIVDKIQNKISTKMDSKNETALDFESFLKYTKIQEGNSQFEQEIFESLNLDSTEQGNKKVNIFVGRFQPFTMGHVKVFETLYKENKLPVVVFIVRSGKRADNKAPFDEDTQMQLFASMTKEYKFLEAIFITKNASIDSIFNELRPAYEPVLWGTGTDRFSSYKRMIERYKEELNALDELEAYEIKRGEEDISATKVRAALSIGDKDTFKKLVPKSMHPFFNDLQIKLEQVLEKDTLTFDEFIKTDTVNETSNFSNLFKSENNIE